MNHNDWYFFMCLRLLYSSAQQAQPAVITENHQEYLDFIFYYCLKISGTNWLSMDWCHNDPTETRRMDSSSSKTCCGMFLDPWRFMDIMGRRNEGTLLEAYTIHFTMLHFSNAPSVYLLLLKLTSSKWPCVFNLT